MRATGITDYLKSDGSLSEARKMANHADTRTTQLYDRRSDAASLDEYSKVGHKVGCVRFSAKSRRILRRYSSTACRNASREGDLCTPSLGGRPQTAGGGNL